MKCFAYTACDATGKKCTGTLDALDKLSGVKQIEEMGLFPVSLAETAIRNSGSQVSHVQRFHLCGAPVVAIVFLAFLLPFLSVSCERNKVLSITGYKAISLSFEQFMTSGEAREVDANVPARLLCPLLVLLISSAVLSTVNLALSRKQSRRLVMCGVLFAGIGLSDCALLGYMVGHESEEEIKVAAARDDGVSENGTRGQANALGMGILSEIDVTFSMDCGYYLAVFSFLLGLGGVGVPYFLRPTPGGINVFGVSMTGGVLGVFMLFALFMAMAEWRIPARYASESELRADLLGDEEGNSISTASSAGADEAFDVESVGRNGRLIFDNIMQANAEREPLGFGSVWPKTGGQSKKAAADISDVHFSNSTDYFFMLSDGVNLGSNEWSPFVANFDFSLLSGASVPRWDGKGKFLARNNMWCILANVADGLPGNTPVLVTRNIDVDALRNAMGEGVRGKDMFAPLKFDSRYTIPFGDSGGVIVAKSGDIIIIRRGDETLGTCFGRREFPPLSGEMRQAEYLRPE